MTDSTAITITRYLPVPIDSYRKNALADELALQRMEELRIAEHLKSVSESLKLMIKECQKKQTLAASAISAGYEMKEIACEHRIDLSQNRMVTYRIDTGAQVEERALTADEVTHSKRKKEHVLRP